MATCAELLAQAREALHKLLTGTQMVSVGYRERRVQYTQANVNELRQYIRELEAQCGDSGNAKPRRPFEVTW